MSAGGFGRNFLTNMRKPHKSADIWIFHIPRDARDGVSPVLMTLVT